MNKDVKYNGYTAVPSDYESPDGDLAMSLNLINEEGSITGLCRPRQVDIDFPEGYAPIYIHNHTDGTLHYILADKQQRNIKAQSGSDSSLSDLVELTDGDTLSSINAIGNTLCIYSGKCIYYVLYKERKYTLLGSHLPEVSLLFGFEGHEAEPEYKDRLYFPQEITHLTGVLSGENSTYATEHIMGLANRFVNELGTEENLFTQPFFVRYALRLYDGTLSMHSAPVLMRPVVGQNPIIQIVDQGDHKEFRCWARGIVARLRVSNPDAATLSKLTAWSDIVKSVDIFISAPLFSYDQSGDITKFDTETPYSTILFDPDSSHTDLNSMSDVGGYTSFNLLFPPNIPSLQLPRFADEEYVSKAKNCAAFYLLSSTPVEKLTTSAGMYDVKFADEALTGLLGREQMTDDYDSHDHLSAKSSYNYNSRVNLLGIRKRIVPLAGQSSWQYMRAGGRYADVTPYIYIKKNNATHIFKGAAFPACVNDRFDYTYYPDADAYKILLIRRTSSLQKQEISLTPHDFLNGAVSDCLNIRNTGSLWVEASEDDIPADSETVSEITVNKLDKIYVSDVNNPFVYPVTGILTIGCGEIYALSSAAKALSEGQFGQFPLYAFTDEGVWAMEVSTTGTYFAKQPITRDICINPDGITQIDSAVLFPTKRGIMLLSGSQTQCISEAINSEYPFNVLSLPGMGKLHAQLGHEADSCLPTKPFSDFLAGCGMVYDYTHQRIIVFNKKYTYAYVFSPKSNAWGMMFSNIEYSINSYPEALAVDKTGRLVDFTQDDLEAAAPGLLVTRPLNLDTVNIHKTVDNIIQRGNFAKGNVKSVLYGSRDLINWHLVWSSKDHYLRGFRGTPYKYFRIALLCDLAPGESIYGASVQFTPRLTNQPR